MQTIDLVPDWVCEGLSPSTVRHDKARKLRKYARYGVGHLWYADPKLQTLEIYTLKRGTYHVTSVTGGSERGVFAPFTFEIDVAMLWTR